MAIQATRTIETISPRIPPFFSRSVLSSLTAYYNRHKQNDTTEDSNNTSFSTGFSRDTRRGKQSTRRGGVAPSVMFAKGPALIYPIHTDSEDNPSHVFHRTATAASLIRLFNITNILYTAAARSDLPMHPWCSAVCRQRLTELFVSPPGRKEGPFGLLTNNSYLSEFEEKKVSLSDMVRAVLPLYLLRKDELTSRPLDSIGVVSLRGPPTASLAALAPYIINNNLSAAFASEQHAAIDNINSAHPLSSDTNGERVRLFNAIKKENKGESRHDQLDNIALDAFIKDLMTYVTIHGVPHMPQMGSRQFPRSPSEIIDLASREADGSLHNYMAIHTQHASLVSSGAEGCEAYRCDKGPFVCDTASLAAHKRCSVPYIAVAVSLPTLFSISLSSKSAAAVQKRIAELTKERASPNTSTVFESVFTNIIRERSRGQADSQNDGTKRVGGDDTMGVTVNYAADTANFTRKTWHGAIRALRREAMRLRRDVDIAAHNFKKSDDNDWISYQSYEFPQELVHLLRCHRRSTWASSKGDRQRERGAPQDSSTTYCYLAEWRARLVHVLALGKSKKASHAHAHAERMPSVGNAYAEYLGELFAALLERLSLSTRGGGTPPPSSGSDHSVFEEEGEGSRPQLMCYRRAFVMQVRHSRGTGTSYKWQPRGALLPYAPANCNTREVLSATYDTMWQRFGMCKRRNSSVVREENAFRGSKHNKDEKFQSLPNNDDAQNRNSGVKSSSFNYRDEPKNNKYRDAHPLLTLPINERVRLRKLFFASRARVSELLRKGAVTLLSAGVKLLKSPNNSLNSSDSYFNFRGLKPSPLPTARPLIVELVQKVGEAQRAYDDVLMGFLRRDKGKPDQKKSHNEELGRPIKLLQLHRSAKRALAVFRPLFSVLDKDGISEFIDFGFMEGIHGGTYTGASSSSLAAQEAHQGNSFLNCSTTDNDEVTTKRWARNGYTSYIGTTTAHCCSISNVNTRYPCPAPPQSRSFAIRSSPRFLQVHHIQTADVILGLHGADLHAIAYAKPTAMVTEMVPPWMDRAYRLNGGYFAPTAFAREIGYLRVFIHRVETLPDHRAETNPRYYLHHSSGFFGGQSVSSLPDLRQTYALSVCTWLAMSSVRLAEDKTSLHSANASSNDTDTDNYDFILPWWCRGGASAAVRNMMHAALPIEEEAPIDLPEFTAAHRESSSPLSSPPFSPFPPSSSHPHRSLSLDAVDARPLVSLSDTNPSSLLDDKEEQMLRRANTIESTNAILRPTYYTVRGLRSSYGFVEPLCSPLQPRVAVSGVVHADPADSELDVSSLLFSLSEEQNKNNFIPGRFVTIDTSIGHSHLKRIQSECAKGVTVGSHGLASFKVSPDHEKIPETVRYRESMRLRVDGLQSLLEAVLLRSSLPSSTVQLVSRLIVMGSNATLRREEEREGKRADFFEEDISVLLSSTSEPRSVHHSKEVSAMYATHTDAADDGAGGNEKRGPESALCGVSSMHLPESFFPESGGVSDDSVREKHAKMRCLRRLLEFSFNRVFFRASERKGDIDIDELSSMHSIQRNENIDEMSRMSSMRQPVSANALAKALRICPRLRAAIQSALSSPLANVGYGQSGGGGNLFSLRDEAIEWVVSQYFRVFGRVMDTRAAVAMESDEFSYGANCSRWMPFAFA